MKRIQLSLSISLLAVSPMLAQETYENMKVMTEDLNGTARYVGMGGAMEALGADISTISSNPAGVGLMRKSSISASFGLVSQQDASDFPHGNKTNMSFDQAGFVYTGFDGNDSWVNLGFNFHKSRNFDYILSAADGLGNASQNKLTYAKAKNGLLYEVAGELTPDFNRIYASCNQLDDIYARNLNYDTRDNTWYYDEAWAYALNRAQKGYVGEYDINLSGGVKGRVYWGLTVGIHDVRYRHYGEYTEQLDGFHLTVADDRDISGTGYDIKAGVIVRPIEQSGFRIGAYVHTPTWYTLTTSNDTYVSDGSMTVYGGESYKFKLYTPWRFGLSLGHTVGSMLALGATYEYTDYGSLDTRYVTDSYLDWYGDYHDRSESDNVMNRHTEQTLKGVSTLKLGAELKPAPELAVRLGYNYISPMYSKDGFKDGTLSSDGSYYSSATDYTNWDCTHRITAGLGYTLGNVNLSAAYQYSMRKGDFYPFMNYMDNDNPADDNICNSVKVNDKRHQLIFTLGYTF